MSLTKTPLLIWRRRRSCIILRGFGAILLMLLGMNVREMRGQGKNEGGLPLDADDEDEFGLARHVEVAFLLRNSGEADLLALLIKIFFDI